MVGGIVLRSWNRFLDELWFQVGVNFFQSAKKLVSKSARSQRWLCPFNNIQLTNRFHVAVRLFSNRSQMTSKCGKNKKLSGILGDSRVCQWCSYHSSTSSVIYYWTDARQHLIYLFYIARKQPTTEIFFYCKIFQHHSKARLCPALRLIWQTPKKPFDVIYCLFNWSNLIGCSA